MREVAEICHGDKQINGALSQTKQQPVNNDAETRAGTENSYYDVNVLFSSYIFHIYSLFI